MPKGVTWIQQAAAEIDPDSRVITGTCTPK